MTSPRSTYGGGYYAAPAFPDTPIYDMLVAERGTPQIAPIRVPAAYDTGSQLPALPAALPALPSAQGPQHTPPHGYPAQQPAPLQQTPAPYIPPQSQPRGYPAQPPQQQPGGQQPQMRPVAPHPAAPRPAAPHPAAPRPAPPRPAPSPYNDPYGRPYQGRGY